MLIWSNIYIYTYIFIFIYIFLLLFTFFSDRLCWLVVRISESEAKKWRRVKEKKGRCEPRICHQADTNWAACNLTECTKRRVVWGPGGPRRWSGFPLLVSFSPPGRFPAAADNHPHSLVLFASVPPLDRDITEWSHFTMYSNFVFSNRACHEVSPTNIRQPLETPHYLRFPTDYGTEWALLHPSSKGFSPQISHVQKSRIVFFFVKRLSNGNHNAKFFFIAYSFNKYWRILQ